MHSPRRSVSEDQGVGGLVVGQLQRAQRDAGLVVQLDVRVALEVEGRQPAVDEQLAAVAHDQRERDALAHRLRVVEARAGDALALDEDGDRAGRVVVGAVRHDERVVGFGFRGGTGDAGDEDDGQIQRSCLSLKGVRVR